MKNLNLVRNNIVDNSLHPIKEMFRVCLIDKNIVLDLSYSLGGRGCYLLKNKETILFARKKNSLAKGLKTKVDDSIYESLLNELERK